jgi:hypothetical protein
MVQLGMVLTGISTALDLEEGLVILASQDPEGEADGA